MPSDPKKRILVVDDEEHICRIIVESLGDENFVTTSFTDPVKALEHIATNPVDLVLTDMVMKEHSGLQIIEATLENHPNAIVILMTAYPTVKAAISVLKRGAYDFLVKPFKLDLLNATIKRGLAHQKVVADNLSLKSQVEFLKAANSFFGTGLDLEKYLKLILNSCNTELSATASAFMEIDSRDGSILRCIHKTRDGQSADSVLDHSLADRFGEIKSDDPIIHTEDMSTENGRMYRLLISKPILIRGTLRGLINVSIISRSDQIAHGKLGVLSILASSAASAITNQKLYHDLKSSYWQAIHALANAIEARDLYTAGHTDRVMKLAEATARYLGWDEKQIQYLRVGCTLHDVGKIAVPDAILNKTGRLTDEERRQMEEHPNLGLKIIADIDLFEPSIPYIIAHHERYDGKGYPKGLRGQEIPIEGRILAVADTFDAIMSDRPYRKGAAVDKAVRELIDNKGTQFDPDLVDRFIEVLRDGRIDLKELYGCEEGLDRIDDLMVIEKAPA